MRSQYFPQLCYFVFFILIATKETLASFYKIDSRRLIIISFIILSMKESNQDFIDFLNKI